MNHFRIEPFSCSSNSYQKFISFPHNNSVQTNLPPQEIVSNECILSKENLERQRLSPEVVRLREEQLLKELEFKKLVNYSGKFIKGTENID